MEVKEFLAKIILGSDIHKDLAIAKKEEQEAQDKYNNAYQTICLLEEKKRELNQSLETFMQEISFLQSEKESIDTFLSQLQNDEVLGIKRTIQEVRLDEKKIIILGNLIEKILSSSNEYNQTLIQLKSQKEKKISLEHDIDNSTRELELMKEKSKHRDEQKAKRKEYLSQRRGIRDNLLTLKNEWQKTLDDFKARLDDADSLKSFKELERELKDYERRINNAIEIYVK